MSYILEITTVCLNIGMDTVIHVLSYEYYKLIILQLILKIK
jgi:hypothetical protein